MRSLLVGGSQQAPEHIFLSVLKCEREGVTAINVLQYRRGRMACQGLMERSQGSDLGLPSLALGHPEKPPDEPSMEAKLWLVTGLIAA
jgi:hypothetical protein